MKHAIVIFSGGQDSTTCLGGAKNRYEKVQANTFEYGQKHSVEIQQAKKIAQKLDVPLTVIDLSFYHNLVESALFAGSDQNLNAPHQNNADLPASFVPNRNALFILLAHSHAQTLKADVLITGVCQTDYSGYPDCRADFIDSISKTLDLGSGQNIPILTPLMYLTKAETFELADQEGVLDIVLQDSHTCYAGSDFMNSWGRGCGSCPACLLRKNGFEKYEESLKNRR